MPGIFISRGLTVGIPAGGLVIGMGADGKTTSSLTLHVNFDVCPTWLELAFRHLNEAKERQWERAAAWAGTDEQEKASTLEREFESSMQAIMASAIAVDAFYAALRKKAEISEALVAKWREKRTARYVQVTEVIRMAFGLKNEGVKALRQNLKEIYRLRDLAVHPSGDIEAAILHPELDVGVEWRFAFFRHHNADLIVRATANMFSELATSGKPKNTAIQQYAEALRTRLAQARVNPDTVASVGDAECPTANVPNTVCSRRRLGQR